MDFHVALEHRWRSFREKLDWRKSTSAKRIRRATLPRVSRTLSRLSTPRSTPKLARKPHPSANSRWSDALWWHDALRCLPREALDSCQLTCRRWQCEIDQHSHDLPLRRIQQCTLIAIERSKKNEVRTSADRFLLVRSSRASS